MQIQFIGGDEQGGAAIEAIEKLLRPLPQVGLHTAHVVNGGVCTRTIRIPAGTFLTGARTEKDHINVVHGDITVTTPAGPLRIQGFHAFPVAAGHKRAGHTHADTYWTTIWRTDLTDVAAIEDEMTLESSQLQTRREGIEFAPKTELVA